MKKNKQITWHVRLAAVLLVALLLCAGVARRLPQAAAATTATTPNGLTATGNQLWEQGVNLAGGPQAAYGTPLIGQYRVGDQLGRAVGSGDFNGDGYADLAIGVPGEDALSVLVSEFNYQSVGKGTVEVIYGTAAGLSNNDGQVLEQGKDGIAGTRESGDLFGAALAVADFNHDGYADLAIGVPGEHSEIHPVTGSAYEDSGMGCVNIIYGSPQGLVKGATKGPIPANQYLAQNAILLGAHEKSDMLGTALTTGDFNKDGYADLAIGAPGEDGASGAVNVIYGSKSGLSDTPYMVKTRTQIFDQNSDGIWGGKESGDEFGKALAAGDFNHDGYTDLAIGIPGEGIGGDDNAGSVAILYGSENGLGAWNGPGNQLWDEDGDEGPAYEIEGIASDGDNFGAALAAGDFNNDGACDLAIGIPTNYDIRGAVSILYGTAMGLHKNNNQQLLPGTDEWVEMGRALAAADFNSDGITDLAVGVPEDHDSDASQTNWGGSVRIYLGHSTGGFSQTPDQVWSQNSPDMEGGAEKNDWFGDALAVGDFDHNGFPDLAVGVWGEDGDAGAVSVIYGAGNHEPIVNAGGPYSVTNCSIVTLDASQSSDKDQSTASLIFAWDLDGDGIFGESSGATAKCGFEIGMTAAFSPSCLTIPASVVGTSSITVSLKVTDKAGSSTIGQATIKLSAKPPVLTVPADIKVPATPTLCQSMVNPDLLKATATSPCQNVTVTATRNDGKPLNAYFPIGVTAITWKATDSTGLSSTGQQFITVIDDFAPVLQGIPADINLIASPGQTTAYYLPVAPTASDACSGATVTGTRSDAQSIPSPYPLGTTQLTWKATDGAGNQTAHVQLVSVKTKTDVAVSLSSRTSTTSTGQPYSFQMNVSNVGPALAIQPSATVTLPNGWVWLSATPSNGNCSFNNANRQLACGFSTLNPNDSRTVEINVQPTTVGAFTITANANANPKSTVEAQAANNTASHAITVQH